MSGAEAQPAEETDGLVAFLAGEGVPAGARILDVPCGIGRRAFDLAKAGYRVFAIDSNEVGIRAARERVPPDHAGRLVFTVSPRERLPGLAQEERFDAILCLDHALGRGPVEEAVKFLGRLRTHAAPEGRLVVGLLNRDFIAVRLRPFSFHVIGNVEQHEFRRFDPVTDMLHFDWKFYERAGDDLRFRGKSSVDLRLLTLSDVADALARTGWAVDGFFSGWDRSAASAERRKVIAVARPARG